MLSEDEKLYWNSVLFGLNFYAHLVIFVVPIWFFFLFERAFMLLVMSTFLCVAVLQFIVGPKVLRKRKWFAVYILSFLIIFLISLMIEIYFSESFIFYYLILLSLGIILNWRGIKLATKLFVLRGFHLP